MRQSDRLAEFVHQALTTGKSRGEIGAAMSEAGWSQSEIDEALGTWAETDFIPPVPRPRPIVSARDAAFYALLFIALCIVAWHVTSLLFRVIDYLLEDSAESYRRVRGLSSMRWSIASLIVFAPVFFLMSRFETKRTKLDPARRRSVIRKWFGYITMTLAGIALLGDLVVVIYGLLDGDLTLVFLAKAGVVALISGVIFTYFRGELDERHDAN